MSGTPPLKLVALALDTYGDHVLRQPLLSGLLDAGHAVTLVMRPAYARIVPFIDARLAVIECDVALNRPLDEAAWAALRNTLDAIRATRPGAVVCLPYNRTAVDEWILRCCDFCERIAFSTARPPVLIDDNLPREQRPPLRPDQMVTRPVDVEELASELEKYECLLKAIAPSQATGTLPRLRVPDEGVASAAAWVGATQLAGRPYAVVAPAGTQNVALKRMPVPLAVLAIRRLWQEHGVSSVLVGIESERAHLDAIRAQVGERACVAQWIGNAQSLGALLGLLKGAQVYVGGDLGTMHFAAAVDIPVVALFGGGTFPRFAPAARRWAGVTKRLACFGCEWNCLYESARCIDEVAPQTWLGALDEVMRGGSPGWVFDPAGIDEHTARVVIPVVSRLRNNLRNDLRVVEEDRAQRLAIINSQAARLAEVEADRERRLEALVRAEQQLIAHQRAIAELNERVRAAESSLPVDRDRDPHQQALQALQARIDEIEADRAERLHVIERQHAELESLQARITEIEADRSARLVLIERQDSELRASQQRLEASERDRAERLAVIEQQRADIEHQQARIQHAEGRIAQLEAERASMAEELESARAEIRTLSAKLAEADDRVAKLQTVRGALSALGQALVGRPVTDGQAERR